jgi:hypothetical protein
MGLTTWHDAPDDNALLKNAGSISAEIAREHAECEFEKYRIVQDRLFQSDYDYYIAQFDALEERAKNKGKSGTEEIE